MRFLAGGPSIPDELLIARDEGRVVFFCGAGVSRARAGLSDFFGLAQRVIESLGVMTDSPARRIVEEAREIESRTGVGGLISADRVFGLLERDFLARDMEAAVAKALKPSPAVDLSAHRIMLDLARGPDAKVRLVTTNFDRLFESCDNALRSWQPPRLPDPQRYEELEGIIHLHGRVNEDYSGADGDGFVLSSSEFGRAYLSDGWATQFIRSILERYFVVFVGYTADDPPVQYLPEALNRSLGSREGIYAFQSGSTSNAQSRWLHKGVQPIAYEAAENHKALWDTLAAWAIRAQNPEVWYESTIALARKGPESLLPHERGQVAHVVSTLEGIKRFSASEELPPAEWLCVFDPLIRYAKPGRLGSFSEEGPYFDPFDAYGLDSDPIPPKIAPDDPYAKREVPDNVWDCFAPTRLDRQSLRDDHFAALRGHWAVNVPRLPARLGQLGVWIQKVSHQPAAVWWASGQVGLHPDIQAQIRFGLERAKKTGSPEIRKAWRYIFEAWETPKNDFNRGWYQLKASIDLDGWTNAAVRDLALIYRPYLTAERPFGGGPKPPENRDDVCLRDMVHLCVKYHDLDSDVQLPDEYVTSAVREFRKNLEHAVSLETELGRDGSHNLCPIEPDPDIEGESSERAYGISRTVLFYVSLFKTLIDKAPGAAKQEYLAWRIDDVTVFARLRIWACGDPRLLSGIEAGNLMCGLNDRVFWDSYHQRDLLLVLAKRWPDFSPAVQAQLGRKLLDGPSPREGKEDAEYTERRAWASLDRIQWLKSRGCEFDFDINTESARLRALAPQWQPQYAEHAAASMEARGGAVETDTDHAALLAVPLANVLSRAAELSGRTHGWFVERNPFAGLASQRPVRAFAALTNAAKHNDYPEWAWRTFLNAEARKSDKPRFSALIAERLSRLPPSALAEIIYIRPQNGFLCRARPFFRSFRRHLSTFGRR
jgi:SIR2-like domain